ncbi:hypothetical protein RHRU231_430050 [Rhodococcus ruber]|uniref:Uncharacterized protein n=1 Tax=Rhodococcus ruber TaxID=1830 RepID=A0A098BKC9_9NOCA|nr:hypothetical protein RHRU231_430050 [Rhodococcus ruber]
MSRYSRYSESSISVSYFSRSSALIGLGVLPFWCVDPSSRIRLVGAESAVAGVVAEEGGDVGVSQAMLPAGAEIAQRRHVRGGAVTLVDGEAVAGQLAVQVDHDPVPGDLGEHARRRDAGRRGVPADDRQRRRRQARDPEPVGENVPGRDGQPHHRTAHALDVGHVHTDGVDLGSRHDHHAPRHRAASDDREQLLPGLLGELLGVVETRERRVRSGIEDARGDDERPGAGAAACLVDPRDRPEPAPHERRLHGAQARGPADHSARRPRGHGCWISGESMVPHREGGRTMNRALPMTLSTGMVPWFSSATW